MKGISPLVASVLLIAFTVSISMIIMGWFSTFTKTTTSNISSSAAEAVGCNSAGINIEHIYIDTTTKTANILVKNSGFMNINVNAILVNKSGSMCSNLSNVLITKGNMTSLYLNCSVDGEKFPAGKADWERAVVTTNCGGIDDSTTDANDVN